MHFQDASGKLLKTVEANEGDDILSIAHEHDIDLEGASAYIWDFSLYSPLSSQGLAKDLWRALRVT